MRFSFSITTLLVFLVGSQYLYAGDAVKSELMQLANGKHRSAEHIARNQYRNPAETLAWFGIQKDMTVVEVSPGGRGWYTEILAPFLRDEGKLYAGSYNNESEVEYLRKNAKRYLDKLAANPDIYDKVVVLEFEPPKKSSLEPKGQADMVLTFRNIHNWVRNDSAEQTFQAMYDVLKPGGVLGLVQHRGKPDMVGKDWAAKGYVAEAEVKRLAQAAGFKFVASSEINANPKDTKDHPKGVWTLPPVYRLKEQDKEKYAAIGESDRMTLKFVKPK